MADLGEIVLPGANTILDLGVPLSDKGTKSYEAGSDDFYSAFGRPEPRQAKEADKTSPSKGSSKVSSDESEKGCAGKVRCRRDSLGMAAAAVPLPRGQTDFVSPKSSSLLARRLGKR